MSCRSNYLARTDRTLRRTFSPAPTVLRTTDTAVKRIPKVSSAHFRSSSETVYVCRVVGIPSSIRGQSGVAWHLDVLNNAGIAWKYMTLGRTTVIGVGQKNCFVRRTVFNVDFLKRERVIYNTTCPVCVRDYQIHGYFVFVTAVDLGIIRRAGRVQ